MFSIRLFFSLVSFSVNYQHIDGLSPCHMLLTIDCDLLAFLLSICIWATNYQHLGGIHLNKFIYLIKRL